MSQRPGPRRGREPRAEKIEAPWRRPTVEVAAALLVSAAALLIRARLLDVPLERDEGEYAYGAQLLLAGERFYHGFYTMKLPGIHLAYAALISIFGPAARGIHSGLALIDALSGAALFILARRFWGGLCAVAALAAFLLMALGISVQGYQANAEHFVLLPALAGLVLLTQAAPGGRNRLLFASGLCLGTAIAMKQHGVLFAAFSTLMLIVEAARDRERRRLLIGGLLAHAAGLALPLGILLGAIAAHGDFGRFYFLCVSYARHYISIQPPAAALRDLLWALRGLFRDAPVFWILAAIGLARSFRADTGRPQARFAVLFLLFSFLATVPGLWFRPHYFILLLPAVALLAGIGVAQFASDRRRAPAWMLLLFAVGHTLFAQRQVLFQLDPAQISRKTYWTMPFTEAIPIADFVRENTGPRDTVAIVGSEPEILFYARRRSATGYIYGYPLTEPHPFMDRMIDEMIREVESSRPKIVIHESGMWSWGTQVAARRRIAAWVQAYTDRDYEQVGVLEWTWAGPVCTWGVMARDLRPPGNDWMRIYLRRS